MTITRSLHCLCNPLLAGDRGVNLCSIQVIGGLLCAVFTLVIQDCYSLSVNWEVLFLSVFIVSGLNSTL